MRISLKVAFFAIGFGIYISFLGGAFISPPDPFTQLLVAAPLLAVVIPVVYRVFEAHGLDELDESPRVPFPYLVAVSVVSTLAAYLAGLLVPAIPSTATSLPVVVRGVAFVAGFLLVSWYTIHRSRADGENGGSPETGPTVE